MASKSTSARQLRDAVRGLVVAHGALETARRPCGATLSVPHAYALLELHRRGAVTVSELAATLAIDRTNVSRLCARMEAAGELSRAVHPEDGRARMVRLTARGKRLAQAVDDRSADHFGRLLDALDDANDVVAALQRLSATMSRAARRDDTDEIGETDE